jgi:hypothetical protein
MQTKLDEAVGKLVDFTSDFLRLRECDFQVLTPAGVCVCRLAENADISAVDVERYKRLAVQQEKSITALQARNQESEARARAGAVNVDVVEQMRSERDQISTLVNLHSCQLIHATAPPRGTQLSAYIELSSRNAVVHRVHSGPDCIVRSAQLKKRRFMFKELQFELLATQAALDAECDLPDAATADAAIRELKGRLARLEARRAQLS